MWVCSHCQEPLTRVGGSLVCASGHTFDVAKEGYVNFLAGRQKSGYKGDTPAMLAARRRFLEAGHYEPLRRRLVEIVAGLNTKVVAEIGCGEGYYVGGISEHISSSMCLGTDFAKEGVRLAAKRYTKVKFAVADTNKPLPLADGSVGGLLDIFAPRNRGEFARILQPNGRLVVVIPTERHLGELRETASLLEIQGEKQAAVERALTGDFRLVEAETLTAPLRLRGATIAELVGMTPNAWFLDEAAKSRLAALPERAVTAEFRILVFGK